MVFVRAVLPKRKRVQLTLVSKKNLTTKPRRRTSETSVYFKETKRRRIPESSYRLLLLQQFDERVECNGLTLRLEA
jgi:hypothetical protein